MDFTFRSGHPALDLAGTVRYRDSAEPEDLLRTPSDLSRWLPASGLVDGAPSAGPADLAAAVTLREIVYRLARARVDGGPADPADRAALNRAAEPPPVTVRLREDGGLARTGNPARALSSLARAAVELLGGPGADRIRPCAGRGCTRLFVDESRRGTRRWCDMAECGNRAKAAGYRARHGA